MKGITRVGLYLSLISPTLLLLACGTEKLNDTASYANKMGQTENTIKEAMPTASVNKTMSNSVMLTEPEADTQASFTEPKAPETSELGLDTVSNDFYGALPYYCDPTRYPQHMIRSIAACVPFLSRLWGTSYGYYQYLPRFLDRAGYRIKHHVGRVSRDEDWDDRYDRYDRHGKKYHKKHKKNKNNEEEDNDGPGFRKRGPRL
jgi:hypothetical protein